MGPRAAEALSCWIGAAIFPHVAGYNSAKKSSNLSACCGILFCKMQINGPARRGVYIKFKVYGLLCCLSGSKSHLEISTNVLIFAISKLSTYDTYLHNSCFENKTVSITEHIVTLTKHVLITRHLDWLSKPILEFVCFNNQTKCPDLF